MWPALLPQCDGLWVVPFFLLGSLLPPQRVLQRTKAEFARLFSNLAFKDLQGPICLILWVVSESQEGQVQQEVIT